MPTRRLIVDNKNLGVQFVDSCERFDEGWRQLRRQKVARTWSGTQTGKLPHGFGKLKDELLVVRDGKVSLLHETNMSAAVRNMPLVKGALQTPFAYDETTGCALEYLSFHTSVTTLPDRLEVVFTATDAFKWRWVVSGTPGSWTTGVSIATGYAEVTATGYARFGVKVLKALSGIPAMATNTEWWFTIGYQATDVKLVSTIVDYQDFTILNVGYELFKVRWLTGWDDANLAARNGNTCAVAVGYWPVACNSFALYYDHLVLSQPVLYTGYEAPEYKFAVSDVFDIDCFLIIVTNEADEFSVDEGKAVKVALLGERMFCYTTKSVYELLYVGGTRVWQFMPRFKNFGLDSTNAFATDGNIHYVLFSSRLSMFDGAQFQLIDEQILDLFTGWQTSAGLLSAFGVVGQYNQYKKEVTFGFSTLLGTQHQWIFFARSMTEGFWKIYRAPCRSDTNGAANYPLGFLYLPVSPNLHSDRACCWWAGEFVLAVDGARANRFGNLLPSGLSADFKESASGNIGNAVAAGAVQHLEPTIISAFVSKQDVSDTFSLCSVFAEAKTVAGTYTIGVYINDVPVLHGATKSSYAVTSDVNTRNAVVQQNVQNFALVVNGASDCVDFQVHQWHATVGGYADQHA